MVDKVLDTTRTLVEHPELITVPGEKSASTNFLGLVVIENVPIRFFPKNVDSFADSKLFPLLLYASSMLGEKPQAGDFEMSMDAFIDITDLASKCYWQGILKGIALLLKGDCFTDHPKRDPFKNGIWYAQARVLNNLRLNNLCVNIPKRQGLFDFTSKGRAGLNLAQTILCAELINKAIDRCFANQKLIRSVLLAPNDLKSQNKIRHKKPSAKTTIFLFTEVKYLNDNNDPIFAESDDNLIDAYNAVKDLDSYNNYVKVVMNENRKISLSCKDSDKIATLRASHLFKRGMTGDQDARIDQLTIDEIAIFHPANWNGMKVSLPKVINKDEKSFADLKTTVIDLDSTVKSKKSFSQEFLNEWYTMLNRKLQQLGLGKLELSSVQDRSKDDSEISS